MSENRLGALLLLRRMELDQAWLALRARAAETRGIEAERRRLEVEAEIWHSRASEPYLVGGPHRLRDSAQRREEGRRTARLARAGLDHQRQHLSRAQARERAAARAVEEARAALEVLEAQLHRWRRAERARRDLAEEGEVEDVFAGRRAVARPARRTGGARWPGGRDRSSP